MQKLNKLVATLILASAASAALAAPEGKERFNAIGFDIRTSTPDEFSRFIKEDMARIAKVIKAAGIKAE